MSQKKNTPKPEKKPPEKCWTCGNRPALYYVDNYGRPEVVGRCRECYERSVYLEARNDALSRS
jgi:hypothetical protein